MLGFFCSAGCASAGFDIATDAKAVAPSSNAVDAEHKFTMPVFSQEA
jgi:hypothetical protein